MDAQKWVLVTGASSGIGRASALLLARNGFMVLAGVRKPTDCDAVREAGGERVRPVLLDVTAPSSIASAAAQVQEVTRDAGLHGLVNNAGAGLCAPMEYVPLESVQRLFEVNVFGQLAVTQAMLPMLRRARGRIINIGSVGAHVPLPFGGTLGATKSALASFNDALRLELHPFGIRVCLIEPAAIATPAVDKTLGDPEATIRAMPDDGSTRYGDMLRAFTRRAYDREKHGSPPEVVARTVLEAMTSARPRARYLVGKDARRMVTLPRLLPSRVLDRLALRVFGLPARFGSR
jgi:NAD(P)-dependent dehydrogenase (short-subunit alcohol dehydrogenase family)